MDDWTELTKKGVSDRVVRYIITGNILQGSGTYGGKLIDYTLKEGGTKKGILLKEGWSPNARENKADSKVVVPIVKAMKYIKSLRTGASAATENSIGFIRTYTGYKVVVPKKRAFKSVYTNEEILKLLESPDGFNMQSGNMVADIEFNDLEPMVNILQDKFNLSMKIPRTIFDMYYDEDQPDKRTEKIRNKAEQKALEMYEQDKKEFEAKKKAKSSVRKPARVDIKLKLKLQKAKLQLLNL